MITKHADYRDHHYIHTSEHNYIYQCANHGSYHLLETSFQRLSWERSEHTNNDLVNKCSDNNLYIMVGAVTACCSSKELADRMHALLSVTTIRPLSLEPEAFIHTSEIDCAVSVLLLATLAWCMVRLQVEGVQEILHIQSAVCF